MARINLSYDDKLLLKEIYDRFGEDEFFAYQIGKTKPNTIGQRLSRIASSGFLEMWREPYTNRCRNIYRINNKGIIVAERVEQSALK